MSPRRVISLSGRLIRFALYAVAFGVLVFFALTRTEVGREGLQRQLERQFARSFDGQLEIDKLKGNLLNQLSADGVEIRDSTGRALLSIDSVVVHPSWRDLFNRTLSTGSVTLINPRVHLHRSEDGAWNVQSILRPRDREKVDGEPWSFRATRVRIINGQLTTENGGSAPALVKGGILFDYADAELRGIDGRAVIDWGSDLKLIDLLELDGHLPELGLDIHSLRGQLLIDREQLAFNESHLDIGASTIHLNGSVSSLAALRSSPGEVVVDVDLTESLLDASELSRILPVLPLRDQLTADVRVQGPLSELVVEDIALTHGGSSLAAEGTLLGLPDSIDYEIALRPSQVQWRDLMRAWPTAPLPSFAHLNAVDLEGYSEGLLVFANGATRFDGSLDLQAASNAGALRTDLKLARGELLRLSGDIQSVKLNLGRLLNRSDLPTSLNGTVTIDAEGTDLEAISGRASLTLAPSTIAHRSLDTLHVALEGSRQQLQGTLAAASEYGSIYAQGMSSLDEGPPRYRLSGRSSGLDLGRVLLSGSLSTSLNTQFTLVGHGSALSTFAGDLTLAFDSSLVARGSRSRVVVPHETSLTVRQLGSDAPRISIDSDVMQLDVTGDVALAPLERLARQWSAAISGSFEREYAKSYRGTDSLRVQERVEQEALRLEQHIAASAHALETAGLETQQLQVNARILRSDILAALIPGLTDLHTNSSVSATVEANEERLAIELDLGADSLDVEGVTADGVEAHLSLAAPSARAVARTVQGKLSVGSSRLAIGGQTFTAPTLEAVAHSRKFDVDADAHAVGADEPFRIDARMDLADDRNRLTVHRIQLAARDQTWQNPDSSVIDFFNDAIVVRDLRLERSSRNARSAEHVFVSGTISDAPDDTLIVDADDILLEHAASMLAIDAPVGGVVNARLALTGVRRRPELTGAVHIDDLAYENRLLGAVEITSTYVPGSPDVNLHLELVPDSTSRPGMLVHESRLAVDGMFRLPGAGSAGRDPGFLDLELDIQRADAFFFEYIFRGDVTNVGGYVAGQGHIGGNFRTPIFEAQLTLREGDFDVPEFNLAYAASGPVSVDEEGIHLDDVKVTDPTGGIASVGGSILFNEYRYFSLDLHGALDEVQIMNVSQSRELPFYGTVWASGDMSLTGPLSSAALRSDNAVTSPSSDLYIPITESGESTDAGFIVFADSVGRLPDLASLTQRKGVLADRPEGERPFLDGLEIDLDISAPEGSTVHLVIDPLLGDVINAVGSGRIQLLREEGDFQTFGSFDVSSGDYLFTAGEVFFRRFLIDSGSITWDGDPLDAMLDIAASYRTRASPDGLGVETPQEYIPIVIQMNVGGRVSTPNVDLSLALDRDERGLLGGYESSIEAQLNQPEQVAQYATSVLLTNSFLLTTSAQSQLSDTRNQLAFNSLSQLVASQLNRYLNYALPNVDLNFGVQGESTQDLDVTYGVALRLLDERLVIRGEGIYQSDQLSRTQQGVLDEFVVEVRLNPSVSVEVFYRREGDPLASQSLNTSTTGAGVSYQTEFPTWRGLVQKLFGWLVSAEGEEDEDEIAAGSSE